MPLLTADLRGIGELRADPTDQQVPGIIWSLNSAVYGMLLSHERSCPGTESGRDWLTEARTNLLFAPATDPVADR